MIDNNNRVVNYLRLSVTDRCNLRCMYCMPEEGIDFIPHSEILSYEEMIHLVDLCAQKGIRKVRITGGEPLIRKGFTGFLEMLGGVQGLEDISLTTNGVLLKELAAEIIKCGISRINVSLDSLKQERFYRITGRDYFGKVCEGLEEAERVGFNPIKINVVAIKGVNDDEILDFARLTLAKPYHVRFIELMPIGNKNIWSADRFISIHEILEKIETIGPLRSIGHNTLDGPAERYSLDGAEGELGFIGALSNHFCDTCNRLRLTAEGHLRGCLFSDQEADIKTPLRQGLGDGHLLDLIEHTILNKPKGHGLIQFDPRKCARPMYTIGG